MKAVETNQEQEFLDFKKCAMELFLNRLIKADKCTIGNLFVDDKFECVVLEDKDRNLTQSMPIEEIKKQKVYAQTAIPAGRYEVVVTFSNRFKQYLPLIMGVPGYEGIRIHPGNTHEHTEGCLLPGTSHTETSVLNSRAAFRSLFAKIRKVEKKEKIFITIQ